MLYTTVKWSVFTRRLLAKGIENKGGRNIHEYTQICKQHRDGECQIVIPDSCLRYYFFNTIQSIYGIVAESIEKEIFNRPNFMNFPGYCKSESNARSPYSYFRRSYPKRIWRRGYRNSLGRMILQEKVQYSGFYINISAGKLMDQCLLA